MLFYHEKQRVILSKDTSLNDVPHSRSIEEKSENRSSLCKEHGRAQKTRLCGGSKTRRRYYTSAEPRQSLFTRRYPFGSNRPVSFGKSTAFQALPGCVEYSQRNYNYDNVICFSCDAKDEEITSGNKFVTS